MQGGDFGRGDRASNEQTCSTNSGDCTSNDKGTRCRSRSADDRSDFKDSKARQEYLFHFEVEIEFCVEQLKGYAYTQHS